MRPRWEGHWLVMQGHTTLLELRELTLIEVAEMADVAAFWNDANKGNP